LKIHWEAHPGDGPPLLLVHGMLAGRALWGPNLAALAAVSRPIVVELWGHGRSPAPAEPESYGAESYVEAFEEIRTELGADRWFLCGQSFGAALTLRYSLDHPDRVIAQIFTNSVSALADAEWIAAMRQAAPVMAESIERGGHEAIDRLPMHPRQARRLPPAVREALLADSAMLDPEGIAKTLRFSIAEISVRHRIAENRVPTLLVCGEGERNFQPFREFAEQTMPQLEVVGCDAGHAVNLEAPAVFNEAATTFLRRFRD
jgi:pimeloyl-ACP methyl ester carboxylesterase